MKKERGYCVDHVSNCLIEAYHVSNSLMEDDFKEARRGGQYSVMRKVFVEYHCRKPKYAILHQNKAEQESMLSDFPKYSNHIMVLWF